MRGNTAAESRPSLTNSKSLGRHAAARRNATKEENDNQDFLFQHRNSFLTERLCLVTTSGTIRKTALTQDIFNIEHPS